MMILKNRGRLLWQFVFEKNDRKPQAALPSMPVTLEGLQKKSTGLSSTWLGHSSLLIHIDGSWILTDPVFEKKVSLIGPAKFKRGFSVEVSQMPQIDAVIVSHDHYDHLNKKSILALAAVTKWYVVPTGVGVRLLNWGIPGDKIVELNWWAHFDLDEKTRIVATPAQHFSGRGLNDRNRTLWASWVIAGQQHKVFFSGDSGYFDGFRKIGEQSGPFDMAFLECGAYHHLWHPVHMYPEETVQAHLDLQARVLHPVHWGTFNLSFHPWYEPMQRLTAAAEKEQVVYATPMVGETIDPDQKKLGSQWWETALETTRPSMLQTSL